jgi:integrase
MEVAMARRGRGEGSISQRRDGRWEARIVDYNGRRRCLYGKTRQEVARELRRAQSAADKGLAIPSLTKTVEEHLTGWLDRKKAGADAVRPQSWNRYRASLELHVMPAIGKIKLAKLTAARLEQLYDDKLAEGLSTGTVHNMAVVLTGALDDAVRRGQLAINPAKAAKRPKVRRKASRVLDVDQISKLLDAANGHRLEGAILLGATTGMREAEILGLRWQDVNLEVGTVRITRELYPLPSGFENVPDDAIPLEGHWVLMPAKTQSSQRTVRLLAGVVEALRRRQVEQGRERQSAAECWLEHDLLFTDEIGRSVEPTGFLKRTFHPLLKAAGLPKIRFHDLRHSVATVLLSDPTVHPASVSALLGHAQISTTLDVYSHVMTGLADRAVESLDRQINMGSEKVMSSVKSSKQSMRKDRNSGNNSVN